MFPELISPYGLLLVSIISLLTSAGIYTLAIRMFRHYGLVDNPGPYGHDRAPVPLGIGIVLYINFAFLSLLLFPMTEKLLILIIL